jgi:D-alanyl-D-alanine endopeptidase (penicillin-binding protein 7)
MRRKILVGLTSLALLLSPSLLLAEAGKKPVKQQNVKKSAHAQGPAKKAKPKAQAKATTGSVKKAAAAGVAGAAVQHVSYGHEGGLLAIHSSAALVLDQTTGKALVEKQADMVVPIASITKLMTAMVVLDARQDLNEVIEVTSEDIDHLKGTRSRLAVGTTMTRETAMLLALMSSENRAANALGRHYPGGLPAFVQAMNRTARQLGMFNSRFEEPTGLSSNNVSTANDLARMVMASGAYPEIRIYSTTSSASVEIRGRIQEFANTNTLVRSDNWQIGVSKTGYISEAGRCLVMQAWVADKPVVIVLLDSDGKMTRVGDANRIKRWMESASLDSGFRPA